MGVINNPPPLQINPLLQIGPHSPNLDLKNKPRGGLFDKVRKYIGLQVLFMAQSRQEILFPFFRKVM